MSVSVSAELYSGLLLLVLNVHCPTGKVPVLVVFVVVAGERWRAMAAGWVATLLVVTCLRSRRDVGTYHRLLVGHQHAGKFSTPMKAFLTLSDITVRAKNDGGRIAPHTVFFAISIPERKSKPIHFV
ncbi:MAG: hypothetical protein R3B47_19040 [Bacteroidia bacterium]